MSQPMMLSGYLTGLYECDDKGTYIVSHTGQRLSWFGYRTYLHGFIFFNIAFGQKIGNKDDTDEWEITWSDLSVLIENQSNLCGKFVIKSYRHQKSGKPVFQKTSGGNNFGGNNWTCQTLGWQYGNPIADTLIGQIVAHEKNRKRVFSEAWNRGVCSGIYWNEKDKGIYVLQLALINGVNRLFWIGAHKSGKGFWHTAISAGPVIPTTGRIEMFYFDSPLGINRLEGVIVVLPSGFRQLKIDRELTYALFGGDIWEGISTSCRSRIEKASSFIHNTLGIRVSSRLNPSHHRCYCKECRGKNNFIGWTPSPQLHGKALKTIYPPENAIGLGLFSYPKTNVFAYHGASNNAVAQSIIVHGSLLLPGDMLEDGSKLPVLLGQFGSKGKPTTYVTPIPSLALEYASRNSDIIVKNQRIGIVFVVAIDPSKIFSTTWNTLKGKNDHPPEIPEDEVEWLIQQRNEAIVTDILLFHI